MRKLLYILAPYCLLILSCQKPEHQSPPPPAPAPDLVWSKTFGGTEDDLAHAVIATPDGGYVLAGVTRSQDGDFPQNHGSNYDAMVLKLDASGNKVWSKQFGGSDHDALVAIAPTPDGGFILAGYTQSKDGDISGNHGSSDAWVIKLDGNGNKQWSVVLGGPDSEFGRSVAPTPDGGYILTGSSNGQEGNLGNVDAWVVKLDGGGNKVWDRKFGGTMIDSGESISTTTDGGYILAGYTNSTNIDAAGNHGEYDAWVIKLDGKGNKIWSKVLGGTNSDYATSIKEMPDGSYFMGGYPLSSDGDALGNHGMYDYWVVKLDRNGTKIWSKLLGGTSADYCNSLLVTPDGGCILSGYSASNDGDVVQVQGLNDAWVVRLDSDGNKKWSKTFGRTSSDFARGITATSDNGWVLVGNTYIIDGVSSPNHGSLDVWTIKIKP